MYSGKSFLSPIDRPSLLTISTIDSYDGTENRSVFSVSHYQYGSSELCPKLFQLLPVYGISQTKEKRTSRGEKRSFRKIMMSSKEKNIQCIMKYM